MRGAILGVVLLVLAAAAGISTYQYQQALRAEREALVAAEQAAEAQAEAEAARERAEASAERATAREVPPAKSLSSESTSTERTPVEPKAPPKPRYETLTPSERGTIQAAFRSWDFSSGPHERSVTGLGPDDAKHLAEWQIRRALVTHANSLEPELPDQLERIVLVNGNTMWGKSASRNGERWAVELITGIKSQLPAQRVQAVSRQPRSIYLSETAEEYREEVAELVGAGSAGDLVGAFALALQRNDREQMAAIHEKWSKVKGPQRLATVVAMSDKERYDAALAVIAPPEEVASTTPPTSSGSSSRTKPPVTERESTPQRALKTPRNLAELHREVGKIRITPRMKSDERDHLLAQLLAWDEWLDKQRDPKDQGKVTDLRQRMSVLRLDLLKSGGFGD